MYGGEADRKSKRPCAPGGGSSSPSCRPPRRAGGSGRRRSGVPWAGSAHTRRCATPATARTWLTSPRVSSWPEATQSHDAWRVQTGAMGGGSAAHVRWRRSWRMTSPCVMTAMRRRVPRCHHDSADLTAKTRGMPMPPSKRPPAVWGHTARQGARRIPAVTGRVVPVGRPSAPWLCGASRPGRSVCMRERRVLVRETRPK